MKNKPLLFLLLFFWMATSVFAQNQSGALGELQISIAPKFKGKPLILGNQLYFSETGDSLYIDLFRFYFSALKLQKKDQTIFQENESYHLIDAEEPSSFVLKIKEIPAGTYDALVFNIGTDSLINVSGAIGGDLDPTKGMYWAWNSGYINFKIEGRSNSCNTLHHAFEFHIGGYMPPYQSVRELKFPLREWKIEKGKTTFIQIEIELSHFFSQLQLANTNSIMIPSKDAARMANYFAHTFQLKK